MKNYICIYTISIKLIVIFILYPIYAIGQLEIVSKREFSKLPNWHTAYYVGDDVLRSKSYISKDNGKSWDYLPLKFRNVSYNANNSRRTHVTSLYSLKNKIVIHFLNVIDLQGIGKSKERELKEGFSNYYIRYYLSSVNSNLYNTDAILKSTQGSYKNPFEGIFNGENAFYLGDIGSVPIEIKTGQILLPVQQTVLRNGKLYNPANNTSFTTVRVLIGTYDKSKHKIDWKSSKIVELSADKSTRGLIEPTIVELPSGKLLMIMRGSNGGTSDPSYRIPSYKWFSVSNDGVVWSSPSPLTYDDGLPVYSPSSMSRLIKTSDDDVYWIGNISELNSKGNYPRNRLFVGEINLQTYTLKRGTIVLLDSLDDYRGNLSHFSVIQDKVSKELVVTYPYGKKWKIVRLRKNIK